MLVAELVNTAFKSGGYTNADTKLTIKNEFIKQVLHIKDVLGAFNEGVVTADAFLANQNACQIIWAKLQIVIHVFETIYDFVESHHVLDFFLKFCQEFFEKLGFSLLLFLSSSGLNNVKSTPESQRIQEQQSEQALSILKNFAEMIQVFLKSCRCIKNNNTQIMMKLMPMMEILDKLFSMRMGNLSKNENNIIFEPTVKPQINNVLTKYKMDVLDSVKELLDFYNHDGKKHLVKKSKSLEIRMANDKKNQKFILHLNSIIRLSLNSLIFYFNDPNTNIQNIYDDVDLQSLIVEAIRIFTMGSHTCEIFTSLEEKKTQLLNYIFMPSFVQNEFLLETLKDNPDEYVTRNIYMTANRQKDFNIRMISIHSLKVLCEQLDGFLTQVISLMTNIIKTVLNLQSPEQIVDEQERNQFVEFMQTSFWNQVDSRLKVDSCMLIITQLVYLVHHREDLVLKVENFIRVVIQQLTIQCDDNLITCRMILFFGKYLDHLFKNDDKMVLDIFKWITSNLHFDDVRGCAAEMAIFSIMVKDTEKKRIGMEQQRIFTNNPLISSLFLENMMHRISINFRPNLIEALITLVRTNPDHFINNQQLFEQYFNKIIVIIKQIAQNSSDSQKPLISNIWYLVKQICDEKKLYLKYRNIIEQGISSLFPLVETMITENNFDEDLVECLISWNSHINDVSPYALNFIGYMEKVQNKNEGSLGSMYNLLNNYFIYAKDKFTQEDVQMVFGMALKSIAVQDNENRGFNDYLSGISSAQGFLLIQMIMANMTHFISDPTLESIIAIFKQFYSKNLNHINSMYHELDYFDDNYETELLENSQPMMYFDKLMGVFLMGAYLFPEKVLKYFLQFEFGDQIPEDQHLFRFTYIIDLICSRFDEFVSDYDKKLWVLSFSRMIEFFLQSFQESNRKEHLDLLKLLIFKTVLILKGFQMQIRVNNDHWNAQKSNRFLDVFMETCEEFNAIREHMKVTRQAQNLFTSSSDCFDMDEDDDDTADFNFVELEKKKIMKDVQSPLLKLDEIQEFRKVMLKVKQNENVFNYVKQDMPEVVAKYFVKVSFEFERVAGRIRNIRKLKPRRKQ